MQDRAISSAYEAAKERYAAMGVDVATAIRKLESIPVSLHCWQGDDVGGFEHTASELGGGLAVTGSYPGKARTAEELRADLDQAVALIPGRHRLTCTPLMPIAIRTARRFSYTISTSLPASAACLADLKAPANDFDEALEGRRIGGVRAARPIPNPQMRAHSSWWRGVGASLG